MKTYFIVAAILAVVGLLPAIYFAGYRQGKNSIVAVFTQAARECCDMESTLLAKLEKAKKRRGKLSIWNVSRRSPKPLMYVSTVPCLAPFLVSCTISAP